MALRFLTVEESPKNSLEICKSLRDTGMIHVDRKCKCTRDMKLVWRKKFNLCVWKCSASHELSAKTRTWFSGTTLSYQQVLDITFYWLHDLMASQVARIMKLAMPTVQKLFFYCRMHSLHLLHDTNTKIGGPGKVVEIDISGFHKRSVSKNKSLKDAWIVGGVERNNNDPVMMFLAYTRYKNAASLTNIIRHYVREGSEIHIESHIFNLESYGYSFSKTVDPVTGKRIESIGDKMRTCLSGNLRRRLSIDYMWSKMWKLQNKQNRQDLLISFVISAVDCVDCFGL